MDQPVVKVELSHVIHDITALQIFPGMLPWENNNAFDVNDYKFWSGPNPWQFIFEGYKSGVAPGKQGVQVSECVTTHTDKRKYPRNCLGLGSIQRCASPHSLYFVECFLQIPLASGPILYLSYCPSSSSQLTKKNITKYGAQGDAQRSSWQLIPRR